MENENTEPGGTSLRDKPFSEIARIVSGEVTKGNQAEPAEETPDPTVSMNVTYAGLGIRVAAFLIDTAILMVPAAVIAGFVMYTNPGYYANLKTTGVIIDTLYFSLMESSGIQASAGKYIMNLKVIDKRGNRISFPRAVIRYFAKIISVVPLFAGVLTIRTDEKHQGWHDAIAGTYVIENK